MGVQIPKMNDKEGVDSVRIVHNACPFFKAFYKGKLRRAQDHSPQRWPTYFFGFLPRRSREDAMGATRCMHYRMEAHKMPSVALLYDLSNAFGSAKQARLAEVCPDIAPPGDVVLFRQCIINVFCSIGGTDLEYIPRDGAPQGTSEAPITFLRVFKDTIARWNKMVYPYIRELVATCPFTAQKVDGSLACFADDIFRLLLVPRSVLDILGLMQDISQWLDEELSEDGFKRNAGKTELVVNAHSPHTNKKVSAAVKQGDFAGRAQQAARHLGGRYSWNGSNGYQIVFRFDAMRKGWWSMGSCWYQSMPYKVKRMLFMVKITAAACTGMESYPLTSAECRKFDSLVCTWLRRMLGGRAYVAAAEDEAHGRRWTHSEVLRHWKLCPMEVEMAARRLIWLRSMVIHREDHPHRRVAVRSRALRGEGHSRRLVT